MPEMLNKIKDAGFDGVEIGIPFVDEQRIELRNQLDKLDLEVVAHEYKAEGRGDEYAKSFRDNLENAASFKPLFINTHTGKDHWEFEENLQLVNIGLEVEQKYNVPILHETHRGRFLYSAPVAKQFFAASPELRINADFSHWTCVSESLLEDQPGTMEQAIARTSHIHARIGHSQGPQVPDPRAPEWRNELKTFTAWWQRIVDLHLKRGTEYITIAPEYGPAPYTWLWPNTLEPAGDFFEINCWMKDYLKKSLKLD